MPWNQIILLSIRQLELTQRRRAVTGHCRRGRDNKGDLYDKSGMGQNITKFNFSSPSLYHCLSVRQILGVWYSIQATEWKRNRDWYDYPVDTITPYYQSDRLEKYWTYEYQNEDMCDLQWQKHGVNKINRFIYSLMWCYVQKKITDVTIGVI